VHHINILLIIYVNILNKVNKPILQNIKSYQSEVVFRANSLLTSSATDRKQLWQCLDKLMYCNLLKDLPLQVHWTSHIYVKVDTKKGPKKVQNGLLKYFKVSWCIVKPPFKVCAINCLVYILDLYGEWYHTSNWPQKHHNTLTLFT